MKSKIYVSLLVIGLLSFFQNCGKVGFSKSPNAQSDAKLTGLAIEPGEQDMVNVAPTDPANPPAPAVPPTDASNPSNPMDHNCDHSKKDPSHDQASNGDDGRMPSGSEDGSADDQDLVACILVDHGKSLKLGLVEAKLDGVNSVASSVCISRAGCLQQVAAKFDVLGAYDRGYCEHNPNVVKLTDAELAALLK